MVIEKIGRDAEKGGAHMGPFSGRQGGAKVPFKYQE